MNKEYTKIIALIVLYDCIIMSLFTVLAIIFDKWWLVFASMIFWKGFNVAIDNKQNDKE